MYFQRLESAMVRTLPAKRSARAAYLYMSLIVEFRALWFYGLYSQALQRARHALSLKRVLGEEQAHLGDMAARLEAAGERSDAHVLASSSTPRKHCSCDYSELSNAPNTLTTSRKALAQFSRPAARN